MRSTPRCPTTSYLQENALAWRRLLCSWRVSLVEYAICLEESKQLLRPQMAVRPKTSNSTLTARMSGTSAAGISRKPTPSNIESAINRPFEYVQPILYRYRKLSDGLFKVEQRVNRSLRLSCRRCPSLRASEQLPRALLLPDSPNWPPYLYR